MNRYDDIIQFWFGRVEHTVVPSENRARIWFGDDADVDEAVRQQFAEDLEKAMSGQYSDWLQGSRGQLALILLLDQFSRHIYRDTSQAFSQDYQALRITLNGIEQEHDHQLSLIERVFYYFPLLHSEELCHQESALRAYSMLEELAFDETHVIYDGFLKFSNHHYMLISRYGRFPQRNAALGRVSTADELEYLKSIDLGGGL